MYEEQTQVQFCPEMLAFSSTTSPKSSRMLSTVVHTCDFETQNAEAGTLHQVQGQPELTREACTQTYSYTARHICTQKHTQRDRQMDGRTDRWTESNAKIPQTSISLQSMLFSPEKEVLSLMTMDIST